MLSILLISMGSVLTVSPVLFGIVFLGVVHFRVLKLILHCGYLAHVSCPMAFKVIMFTFV